MSLPENDYQILKLNSIHKRNVHFGSDVVHYKIELVEENLKVI